MIEDQFSRTATLLGEESVNLLKNSRVAVFGVGGVGGFVVEALARCGVGKLTLFDSDDVAESNINRQIIALHSTVGKKKTEVMRDRIADINPAAEVVCNNVFYLPENADDYDFSEYDYIVDAVDTVSAKLEIIERAYKMGIPVISSMGTGNKLDPTRLEIADIYETSVCPLARVMRRELKARGVKKLKVVYSKEEPKKSSGRVPASCSFVPSVAGLIIASAVVRDICGI